MAKTSEQLKQDLERLLHDVAEDSKRTETYWKDIARHIDSGASSLSRGFAKPIADMLGVGPKVQSFSSSLVSAFTQDRDRVTRMEADATTLRKAYYKERDLLLRREMEEAYKAKRKQSAIEKKLFDEVGDVIKSKMAGAAAAFAGQVFLGLRYAREMQTSLIGANASYAARAGIMRDISHTQAETGNEMADMGKAASALVEYGFDLRSGFRDVLVTVVKMEEGLGVSYQTSAQLAVSVNRIGGNFKAVADTVARIKADTALSAEEAAKFADQISKAVMMLKPGSGSLVDQTTDYISRMAAALKELTGDGQKFVTMLEGFTTEAGMMGASTLGATPDFLASPEQTKLVTERFVRYVNSQLSGSSGFQRMAIVQLLSEQFNTSADVIVNAEEMLRRYNDTQRKGVGLNDEWRKQTSEFYKTVSKIGNSLTAIVQQTLLPFLQHLNPLMEKVASAIQWVASSSTGLYIGMGALAVSAVGAAYTITKLTFAIARFGLASGLISGPLASLPSKLGTLSSGLKGLMDFSKSPVLYALRNPASALAGAAGAARGVVSGGWAGLRSAVTVWLPRIGQGIIRLLGPLGLVATAAVAGWETGKLIAKHTGIGNKIYEGLLAIMTKREDSFRSQTMSVATGGLSRNDILQQVTAMAASGRSADEIRNFILNSASNVKGLHGGVFGKEKREQILLGILEDAGKQITRQRVREGYARQLTDSTAEDKARDEQLIDLFKAVAHNTSLQTELLKRAQEANDAHESKRKSSEEDSRSESRLLRQSYESQSRVNSYPSGILMSIGVPK